MKTWETFPHESDVGVRGRGATLEEAFAQSALALTSVVTVPSRVRCRDVVHLHCEATDPELLFMDWINAVVYEMATHKLVFSDYSLEIDGGHLEATACGEPVDNVRHDPAVEVKGATFTELRVHREPDGKWLVQCVVDV